MKKFLLLLALSFSCTLFAQAKIVNLVNCGAKPNDQLSNDTAMSAAVNDLERSGGGTIVFPNGKVILSAHQNFGQSDKFLNFRLQGNKNSVIEVAGPWVLFEFGNTNQVEIEGLTFVGRDVPADNPNFTDVGNAVIYSPSAQQIYIKNTQFFGIRTNDSIVKAANGDIVIDNVQFDGVSAGITGVSVFSPYQRGLVVRNTTFSEHANWQNQYLSKTPAGSGHWIRTEGAVVPSS